MHSHSKGGFTNIETLSGHEFSYDVGGVTHYIKATEKNHEHGQILIGELTTESVHLKRSLPCRRSYTICHGNHLAKVGGMETVEVRCELGHHESDDASEGGKSKLSSMFSRVAGEDDAGKQSFDMLIKPYWSPIGASRFLELVRAGYYDGVALNRVVPGFLMQVRHGKGALEYGATYFIPLTN